METLETDRLYLRPFAIGDLEAYHRAVYADAEVMRYLPGGVPCSMEQARQVIESYLAYAQHHCWGVWAVVDKTEQQLIGHCGLDDIPGADDIELIHAIARAYWGHGLVTEAAQSVVRYGFEQCKLDQVIAVAVPANVASRRVMEKIGMSYQGLTTRYYGGAELAYYLLRRDSLKASNSG